LQAEKVIRAAYTQEYKLEVVRLDDGGQSCAANKGQLAGAGAKLVRAKQRELARLGVELETQAIRHRGP